MRTLLLRRNCVPNLLPFIIAAPPAPRSLFGLILHVGQPQWRSGGWGVGGSRRYREALRNRLVPLK